MAWLRLATAIIVFSVSCVGFGYLAAVFVHRRKWSAWVLGLLVLVIAFFWPVIVVLYTLHDAGQYHSQHPHDDAPGMVVISVIYVGAPFLFVASIPLTVIGAVIARRRNSHV